MSYHLDKVWEGEKESQRQEDGSNTQMNHVVLCTMPLMQRSDSFHIQKPEERLGLFNQFFLLNRPPTLYLSEANAHSSAKVGF